MIRNKIKLILIFSFLINTNTPAQIKVIYSKKVIARYNRAFEKLPEKSKDFIQEAGNSPQYKGGFAIIEMVHDDTLNLNDVEPVDSSIIISDIDGSPHKIDSSELSNILIMLIWGSLSSDSFNIKVTPWFMSGQTIQHTVIKNKVRSTYDEYYKHSNILKTNDSETPVNNIHIPAKTVKFVLSNKIVAAGTIVYGEAEIITEDFFYLAAYGFKNNILKHRLHYKYLFRLRVE